MSLQMIHEAYLPVYICDPNFSCGLTEPHPATDGDQQSLSPDTQNHHLLQVLAQVITYSTHFVLFFYICDGDEG